MGVSWTANAAKAGAGHQTTAKCDSYGATDLDTGHNARSVRVRTNHGRQRARLDWVSKRSAGPMQRTDVELSRRVAGTPHRVTIEILLRHTVGSCQYCSATILSHGHASYRSG